MDIEKRHEGRGGFLDLVDVTEFLLLCRQSAFNLHIPCNLALEFVRQLHQHRADFGTQTPDFLADAFGRNRVGRFHGLFALLLFHPLLRLGLSLRLLLQPLLQFLVGVQHFLLRT